jgi:pyruvate kinase
MNDILQEMEAYQWQHNQFGSTHNEESNPLISIERKAISRAAKALAQELKIQGIMVPTRSGTTAKMLSADRPSALLIGISSSKVICRQLALNWGVIPMLIEEEMTYDWQKMCNKVANDCSLDKNDNTVLLVSGFSSDPLLNEPVMKLMRIKE